MKLSFNINTQDIVFFNTFHFDKYIKRSFKFVLTKSFFSLVIFIIFFLVYMNSSNVCILYSGIFICVVFFLLFDNFILSETRKNIIKQRKEGAEELSTIEIIDDKIITHSQTAQLSINLSEIQCIYFHVDYLFLYLSKSSSIIIPKIKVVDGDFETFINHLKYKYIEAAKDKEIIQNNSSVYVKYFISDFKSDLLDWLKESRRSLTISLIALLIAFIIIGAFILWLNKDFN